jgi:polyisoprenoid-binding protein YceI
MGRWGVALISCFLSGCGSAQLAAEPATVPTAEAMPEDAESYTLDPSTLTVETDVQAGASYTLRFKAKGQLVVSPRHPLATSVSVDIDTTSAESSLGIVADVAKSDDFLSVAMYPSAQFVSQAVAKDPAGKIVLYGSISLHGSTHVVRVPVRVVVDGCNVDVSSEFGLNRHEYHVDSAGSIDGIVGDTVTVRIRAHPKRKNASCVAAK